MEIAFRRRISARHVGVTQPTINLVKPLEITSVFSQKIYVFYTMKILAIFLLFFFSVQDSSGQQNDYFPVKDGKVMYELTDSAQATQKDLHTRAMAWFANAFRDSKEVIQVSDENSIIGKGNFSFEQAMVPFLIQFSVKVNVKDNKYRIQFYDITYREGRQGRVKEIEELNEKKGRDKLKGNISSQFQSLIESFKKKMSEKDDF